MPDCRHCHTRPAHKPRGLCRGCYGKPEVRRLYDPEPKQASVPGVCPRCGRPFRTATSKWNQKHCSVCAMMPAERAMILPRIERYEKLVAEGKRLFEPTPEVA